MVRDQQECDEAKRLLGKDLGRKEAGEHFKYRKGSNIAVYSTTEKIAEKWRELKAKKPDFVAQMEAILAAERETSEDGPTASSTDR